jgi:hypothetical protein
MFLPSARTMTRPLAALCFLILFTGRLSAAPAGPTLYFDYGTGKPQANPLANFMYFVPLISPELVSVSTSTNNTQCARVLTFVTHTNGKSFHVTCEFEFAGEGVHRDLFDHTPGLKRHDQELKAGKTLSHQIMSINVEGKGNGMIEIDGMTTNGMRTVTEIQMKFNSHGHTSPVNIDLEDISLCGGTVHYDNEYVARVNTLTFRRKSSDPKMEVTLDSIKRKDANSVWSNFWGGFKGMAANMFMPPIKVTPEGNQTMMDFGGALANQEPAFTFPHATRLKVGSAATP